MDDKFKNLYNAIMNVQQQELDDIITFVSTPKGQKIETNMKNFFQIILNQYKQLYPFYFKNVNYYFQIFSDDDFYVYGEVFPQQKETIRINLFPFLLDYYYNNTSLNTIFNKIKTGSYDGMNGPLVEHQLAHILDLKTGRELNEQNVHDETFLYYLNLLIEKKSLR